MNNKLDKLFKNEFFRNFSLLASGTMLSQLVSVAVAPLLSRIYTTGEFGEYAVYLAVVEVLVILSTLRYELGIVISKNRQRAAALLKGANIINISVSLLLLLLLAVADLADVLVFHRNWVQGYYYFIPFGLFGTGVLLIQVNLFNREKAYRKLSLSRFLQTLGFSALALVLGFYFKFNYALIFSAAAAIVAIAVFLIWDNRRRFAEVNLPYVRRVLRRNAEFPRISVPSAVMDTFTIQMPVFFISTFFGKGMTGLYSQAFRLVSLPLRVIGQSVSQLFFRRLSELVQEGQDPRRFILRNWGLLAALGFVPCAAALFFGPEIFAFVLGEEWRESGRISAILAPFLYVSFISQPTSTSFIVFNSQKTLLYFNVASCIMRPAAFLIGYQFQDVYLSILLFSWFEIAQIATFNILLWRKAGRLFAEKAQ